MERATQMSDSIRLGMVLAMAGGFMDAYSYMCRGKVFANAQTGNMLLLGINLAEGNAKTALRYLFPVVAFAIGIMLSSLIRIWLREEGVFHWRQIAVLIEAVILAGVAFIPQEMNLLANSLTSLACGIQVESFRKIHGNGIATTMCIGNLRSAMENLSEYFHTGKRIYERKGLLYMGINLCFVVGAVVGNRFVKMSGEKAIMLCAALLVTAFLMMFIDIEKKKEKELENGWS